MTERLPTSLPQVTPRQREVARLVAEGLTNEQIAEHLDISLAGAKYHVAELLARLHATRREQVAEWYRDGGAEPPRPWFKWHRAAIAIATASLGAAAIAALAIGLPSGGGGNTTPWFDEEQNPEVLTLAHVENLFEEARRGAILHERVRFFHRGGQEGRPPASTAQRQTEWVIHDSWFLFDETGHLLERLGQTSNEDGDIYWGGHQDRFEGNTPTLDDTLEPYLTHSEYLRELVENSPQFFRGQPFHPVEAEPEGDMIRITSHQISLGCYPVPTDLRDLHWVDRMEYRAESTTYFSLHSACWVRLDDGQDILTRVRATSFNILDRNLWSDLVEQVLSESPSP